MKKYLRFIVRQVILSLISVSGIYNYYRRKNKDKVLIMVYHDVIDKTDIDCNHYNYNTTISRIRFAKQLKYINRHYSPITLDDFIAWKYKDQPLPANPVLITFDDGHTNLYKNAIPELNKYNIKGVFFIKSNSFGKIEQNYCEQYLSYSSSYQKGQKMYTNFRIAALSEQLNMIASQESKQQYDTTNEQKYKHLTIEECHSLLKSGHSIQSHTIHHYILSSLNDNESDFEIMESKKKLEEIFKYNISCLAYPFGDPNYDYGDREKKLAKKAGYLLAFSGERKTPNGVSKDEDNFSISRFGDVNHDFLYFKLLLSPIRLVKK